jgi:hypothetical protein
MWSTFSIGAVLGFSIWASSPLILGVEEPWDASGYGILAFLALLFMSGIFSCLSCQWQGFHHALKSVAATALGVFLGQVVYAVIFLPGGAMWLIGVIYSVCMSLFTVIGSVLTLLVKYLFNRRLKNS